MWGFFLDRRRRRAERAALIEADAQELVGRLGPAAYDVARERARDECENRVVDAVRPLHRWTKVKLRVGRMTGREANADTATRMAGRGDA